MKAGWGEVLALYTQAYKTHGGMQTYMRRIAEIATEYCSQHGDRLDCITLTDTGQNPSMHPRAVSYRQMTACSGSKFAFLCQAFVRTSKGSGLCIVGHLGLATTALAMKRFGIISDYILVLHGIEAWKMQGSLVRSAARHAKVIIATTRFTAKEFQIQNEFVASNVLVIPLAVGEDLITGLVPQVEHGAGLRILSVGRLDKSERYKGFDELIIAVAQLRAESIPVTLTIAGCGNDLERLEILANGSGISGHVRFLGATLDDALQREYQTCDVFALPSAKEGFGIVFLDAMRYGKPCIGGRHGGTPEVFRDGVDGFLVEFGDSAQLAQRLRCLYEHPTQAAEMGQASFDRLCREFTYPVMRRRWFAAFDRALGYSDTNVRH